MMTATFYFITPVCPWRHERRTGMLRAKLEQIALTVRWVNSTNLCFPSPARQPLAAVMTQREKRFSRILLGSGLIKSWKSAGQTSSPWRGVNATCVVITQYSVKYTRLFMRISRIRTNTGSNSLKAIPRIVSTYHDQTRADWQGAYHVRVKGHPSTTLSSMAMSN